MNFKSVKIIHLIITNAITLENRVVTLQVGGVT